MQIDYLAAAPLGAWVQGEAQLLRTTRSLVFMQGLFQADGVAVARTSGIFKIGPPFEDASENGAAALGPEPGRIGQRRLASASSVRQNWTIAGRRPRASDEWA
jgi:hypothetical protein